MPKSAIASPAAVAIRPSATPPVMAAELSEISAPVPRGAEGVHHAGYGSKKPNVRGGHHAGVERRHALVEAAQLLAGSTHEGAAKAVFLVREGINQNAGHKIFGGFADGDGTFDIAIFNLL